MEIKVVDVQSHVFPKDYAELLCKSKSKVRGTKITENKYAVDYFNGMYTFYIDLEKYEPDLILEKMEKSRIDAGLISVNIPTPDLLDEELRLVGSQICNDYIENLCNRYPQKFFGLANIAINNPTHSISELNRCLQKSNIFKGAFVSSHINEKNLDDPQFAEFYAQLEARRIPLVLHPTVPAWGEVIKDYSLIPMMGFMVDTSIALMRLILSGTLDKYPKLKIVQPHLGGILPYIMGRIQEQIEVKKRGNANIKKEIKSYFKNIYFDLVSPSDEAIEFALAFVGSKNLMFATDHPWIEMDAMVNYADKMKVSPEEKDDIMGSNACKLFSLKG